MYADHSVIYERILYSCRAPNASNTLCTNAVACPTSQITGIIVFNQMTYSCHTNIYRKSKSVWKTLACDVKRTN